LIALFGLVLIGKAMLARGEEYFHRRKVPALKAEEQASSRKSRFPGDLKMNTTEAVGGVVWYGQFGIGYHLYLTA